MRARTFQTGYAIANEKKLAIMAKAFKCMKIIVNRRKAGEFAKLWYQEYSKRVFVATLYKVTKRKQYTSEVVKNMRAQLDLKFQQKVLLTLRFFVVRSKGQTLLEAKLTRQTLTKAFDALKYRTISNRITNEYIKLRQEETKQRTLRYWAYKTSLAQERRKNLKPLVKRLHLNKLVECMDVWKREVFGAKFIETLHANLIVPGQVRNAIMAFVKWRRYTRLKSQS
jgi:hypothetical protein